MCDKVPLAYKICIISDLGVREELKTSNPSGFRLAVITGNNTLLQYIYSYRRASFRGMNLQKKRKFKNQNSQHKNTASQRVYKSHTIFTGQIVTFSTPTPPFSHFLSRIDSHPTGVIIPVVFRYIRVFVPSTALHDFCKVH